MKGLHTATQNRWIGRKILNGIAGNTQSFDELLGTACRKQGYTLCMEQLDNLVETILVEHRHECGLDFLLITHIFL